MTVDDFVAKYNGVHIDEDGYYGAQCWDVSARYAREVVGCPLFPTGSGGAEGLFRLFQNPIPQYFDRIANNTSDSNQLPQKGDVIVWTASFSPPYGHTALVISANSAGVTVLEQNGNNPGGAAYIKTRNWVGVSGWLRPKESEEMKIDLTQLKYNYFNIYGELYPDEVLKQDGLLGQDYVQVTETLKDYANKNGFGYGQFKPRVLAQVAELTTNLAKTETVKNELVKVNNIKDGEISRLAKENETLKAQAAAVSGDTELLNGFGQWLTKLIARLGVKG